MRLLEEEGSGDQENRIQIPHRDVCALNVIIQIKSLLTMRVCSQRVNAVLMLEGAPEDTMVLQGRSFCALDEL